MEKYELLEFNTDQIRTGATAGYKDEQGEIHLATNIEWLNASEDFVGCISFGDNNLYYFKRNGDCYNGVYEKCFQLYIVKFSITKTTGTRIARVTDSNGTANARPISRTAVASDTSEQDTDETEEIFSIATLQPREEIAMQCLQSMLTKYDNPLNFDNTKVKQLVSKSFLFAQEFINQAVLYREKETTSSTVESNKYASVDSDSLSSDTDKLLFNISTALTNWMAQNKNQYADQQKNGLKVNTSDITVKSTFPDTINAAINGSVKAEVSGEVTTKQNTTDSAE